MSNILDLEYFEWDYDPESNVDHLWAGEDHITPEECEQVWDNGPVILPNTGDDHSGDYKIIGQTDGGRALTLIATYDEVRRVGRIFTGWATTQADRSKYGA